MGERVERVDEHDRVIGIVERGEAVRRRWLHRVAVTVCRDPAGRVLVHRRSDDLFRFPGRHEIEVGGAVAVGESYEAAAARELAEELGVRVRPRPVFRFLNRGGLSPVWVGVHEAVLRPAEVRPYPGEIAWHAWLPASEVADFMRRTPFTPDSPSIFRRYLASAGAS
jgi:8-oxo-dGTP pyrophosphatase MutT (NUDIX family)